MTALRTRVSDAEKNCALRRQTPACTAFSELKVPLRKGHWRRCATILLDSLYFNFSEGTLRPVLSRQGGCGVEKSKVNWIRISDLEVWMAGETSDLLELVRRATKDIRDHDRSKLENRIVKNFNDAYNREARQLEWVRRCDQSDCASEDNR